MTLIALIVIVVLIAGALAYILVRKFGARIGDKIELEKKFFENGGSNNAGLLGANGKARKRTAPKGGARKEVDHE